MDTLSTVSPVAAALALADVLGLDLPEPNHVTVSPWAVNSTSVCAVDLQFRGLGKLGALHDWAAHFGVTVVMPEPERYFAHVYFSHSGVRFQCYADLRPNES